MAYLAFLCLAGVDASGYGIVAPVHCISRLRPPTDMSSSFGPKNINLGRIGRVAIRMNGSIQPRWLAQ